MYRVQMHITGGEQNAEAVENAVREAVATFTSDSPSSRLIEVKKPCPSSGLAGYQIQFDIQAGPGWDLMNFRNAMTNYLHPELKGSGYSPNGMKVSRV